MTCLTSAVQQRRRLFVIAEQLHDVQHLFESNETPTVLQLVVVDRFGQLAGVRREVVVRVGELPAFAAGVFAFIARSTAIEKRGDRAFNDL
jgi:hypothetical protein